MWQPKLEYQLTFEGSWPTAVTFLDSPRRVVAGNQNGEIYEWALPETPPELPEKKPGDRGRKAEAPDLTPVARWDGHVNCISHLLFDSAHKCVFSASFDRTVRIWDPAVSPTGTADAVLDIQARRAEAKRTRNDEALARPGVTLDVKPSIATLEGHVDWIHAASLSQDGSRLISGDAAANVIVWDCEQRTPIARWKGHPWNWIVAAAFAPDAQTVVVSEYRYKRDDFDIPTAGFKIWNVAEGSERLDLLKIQFPKLNPRDHSYGGGQVWRKFTGDGLVAVDYSPDGKLIAAGQGGETDTGRVHLLDTETGKLVRDVSGHQYGITAIRFSRDGKHLFTAGRDTCVRICQVEDGKEVAVLGTPRGGQFKDWIAAFALSPEETHLAAADISGHVAVWRLKAAAEN